ncbi:MAG: HAD-IA family hydrolase [Myxococcota bacterium]
MSYDCVLFDLDGTLLDSTELIIASYRHTLEAVGHPAPSDEEVISGFGTPLLDNLRRMGPEERTEEMIEIYSEHNGAHHDQMVRAFPGAREVVETLAVEGRRLGVVTGKRRFYALKGLSFLGLLDHFETVITPERTKRGKPAPDPVLAALEDMDCRPEDTLFVGDSVHDMRAGQQAGTAVGAATWGPFRREALVATQPDYVLETLEELLELTRNLRS